MDAILVGVLAVSAAVFYWITTDGTWSPLFREPAIVDTGRFFSAQASAMTHGRLWVNPSLLPDDCFVHNGRCFGYFGLTPSLLRLPFLPLLDSYQSGFTPVFLTAGLALATGSFLASLRHLLAPRRLSKGAKFLIAPMIGVTFGAGSVLMALTPANVYDEAIAWAVGFLSFSIFCLIRWWEGQQLRWFLLLLGSLVLATNSRPTAVPFALVIGVGVGYRLWTTHRLGSADRQMSILWGALIVLPLATCLGTFVLKFGVPVPNYLYDQAIGGPHAAIWWVRIRRLDHDHLQSLRFVPTTLLAYLRPDTLDFAPTFPWVGLHLGSLKPDSAPITYIALTPGSLYTGPMTSLTAAMPLAFLSAIGGALSWLWRRTEQGARRVRSFAVGSALSWKILVLVAAVSAWCVTLTSIAVNNRYLGDAFPLVALLELLGFHALVRRFEDGSRTLKVGIFVVVAAGVSWQLLVNVGLAWRYRVP